MNAENIDNITTAYERGNQTIGHGASAQCDQSDQSAQYAQNEPGQGDEQTEQRQKPYTWANDLPDPPSEEVASIWGPLVMRGAVALWSGVAGVGKTTLALNVAVSAARGTEFGGLALPKGGLKVLLVDLETPSALRKHKLDDVAGGSNVSGLAYWDTSEDVTREGLEEAVTDGDFDLVIVDTLSHAMPVLHEDDNARATKQMAVFKRIAERTGTAFVLIHHLGKNTEDQGSYNSRGASARPAAADIVVDIKNNERVSDVITLHLTKSRYVPNQVLHLKKVEEGQTFEVVEGLDDACASAIGKACVYILDRLEKAGAKGLSLKDIRHVGTADGHREATTRRALSQLIAGGQIKRPTRGLYVHFKHCRSAHSAHSLEKSRSEHSEQGEQTE